MLDVGEAVMPEVLRRGPQAGRTFPSGAVRLDELLVWVTPGSN